MYMQEPTISFSIHEDREKEVKQILTTVYDALRQKGYNPINQIVGYILSEDPTYITTYNNARSLIRRVDRDEPVSYTHLDVYKRQAHTTAPMTVKYRLKEAMM